MTCAGFEQALARLLGGELDHERYRSTVDALRRHGGRCDECRASLQLIDPPDLAPAPPPGYWDGFDARLASRIASAPGTSRRPIWFAAAGIVVVVLGAWAVTRWPGPPADVDTTLVAQNAPRQPLPEPTAPPAEPPAELAVADDADIGWFSAWDQDDEAGQVSEPDAWTGTAGWADGLFPETERLSPEAQQDLLRWLEEQTS